MIGFESTGPYAEPLFHYLRKKPVTLVQINPMHRKRVKELTGNSPNETDTKDPRVIADVISLGHALTLAGPEGAAAQRSIGIKEGKESICMEVSHLALKIAHESCFIDELEQQMDHYLDQIPYSHSILSIKGIGRITVAGLIGEVGDFTRFHTISEMMKLAGLNLFEVSSGKHRGKRRISKRGRSLMRKLLYFTAINVVKSHGIMHEHYQEMLNRGMIKMKALVAISRKLLMLIFALARDNTVYVENYSNRDHLKLAA